MANRAGARPASQVRRCSTERGLGHVQQAEQFMASRAHAHVVTTHSGHDVPAARPGVVDSTIVQAAQAAG